MHVACYKFLCGNLRSFDCCIKLQFFRYFSPLTLIVMSTPINDAGQKRSIYQLDMLDVMPDKKTCLSLDSESESENLEIQPLYHIYYEIKAFTDVEIIYKTTCFHLHRQILCLKSVYFKHLLEEKGMNIEPIHLPILNIFGQYEIDDADMKQAFDLIYHPKDLTNRDVFIKNKQPEYNFHALAYISHYFQVDHIQTNLIEILKSNLSQSKPNALLILYTFQDYRWNELEHMAIEYISTNLKFYVEDIDSGCKSDYDKYWSHLAPRLQKLILTSVLTHAKIPVAPFKLLGL